MRTAERFLQGLGERSFEILPTRDDDDIGVIERGQPMRHEDAQPRVGLDHAFLDPADTEVEARQAELGAVGAEHQARHGEMERADAVKGENGNDRIGHEKYPARKGQLSQFFRMMSIGTLLATGRSA
ncbi:hypothetical protein X752_04635 [Mesorhizobium sp. LNJC398B00]|nr:hypothetical protein X752_04635 [Mesorhizobium sp. LNJC398B00]